MRLALASRITLVVDLRVERRARLGENARGLLDVGSGDLDVVVVGQRVGDQIVEHGIAELLPPFRVRGLRRLLGARRRKPQALRLWA